MADVVLLHAIVGWNYRARAGIRNRIALRLVRRHAMLVKVPVRLKGVLRWGAPGHHLRGSVWRMGVGMVRRRRILGGADGALSVSWVIVPLGPGWWCKPVEVRLAVHDVLVLAGSHRRCRHSGGIMGIPCGLSLAVDAVLP